MFLKIVKLIIYKYVYWEIYLYAIHAHIFKIYVLIFQNIALFNIT